MHPGHERWRALLLTGPAAVMAGNAHTCAHEGAQQGDPAQGAKVRQLAQQHLEACMGRRKQGRQRKSKQVNVATGEGPALQQSYKPTACGQPAPEAACFAVRHPPAQDQPQWAGALTRKGKVEHP